MSVCVVSFSSRKNGNCTKIGEFVASKFPQVKFYDFSDFAINVCGHCNYQCFSGGSRCPFANDKECDLLDAITKSTLTFFIVPNYCDFPCANFFIFNERSLCYFQNNEKLLNSYLQVPKKFIVVSNTNKENFKTAFAYHCNDDPEILFLSAKKYGKASIDGNLLTSEQAVTELEQFINL